MEVPHGRFLGNLFIFCFVLIAVRLGCTKKKVNCWGATPQKILIDLNKFDAWNLPNWSQLVGRPL